MKIQVPTAKKSRGGEAVRSSKELERWSPGMMREAARWLVEDVQRREVRMMGISWDEHIQLGHVPFRRDCKICQGTKTQATPTSEGETPVVWCPELGHVRSSQRWSRSCQPGEIHDGGSLQMVGSKGHEEHERGGCGATG